MNHYIKLCVSMLLGSMTLASCGDSDSGVKFENKTIFAGDKMAIENAAKYEWTSSNELIATMENGELCGNLVGEATLSCKKGSFKATVKPTSTYIDEPCLNFGATSTQVDQYMTGKFTDVSFVNSDGDVALYQKNYGSVAYYMYMFDSNRLKLSSMFLYNNFTESLAKYLTERYMTVTVNDDKHYIGMISPDMDMLVVFQPEYLGNTLFLCVSYAPYEGDSKSAVDFSPLIKEVTVNAEDTDAVKQLLSKFK